MQDGTLGMRATIQSSVVPRLRFSGVVPGTLPPCRDGLRPGRPASTGDAGVHYWVHGPAAESCIQSVIRRCALPAPPSVVGERTPSPFVAYGSEYRHGVRLQQRRGEPTDEVVSRRCANNGQ